MHIMHNGKPGNGAKFNSQPKKLSQLRDAPVSLPPKWQNSQAIFVLEFKKAESTDQQLNTVTEMFSQEEAALPFLSDLLFSITVAKHPVRNKLLKLFSNQTVERYKARTDLIFTEENLIHTLLDSLTELCDFLINEQDCDALNNTIFSITICIQNKFCRQAISMLYHLIMPIIHRTLNHYWMNLSHPTTPLSPSMRHKYLTYIQNLLRLCILLDNDCKVDTMQLHGLSETKSCAEIIARSESLPWDVRSIAGLTVAHMARIMDDLEVHIDACLVMKDSQDLAIKSQVLLLIEKTNFNKYAIKVLEIVEQVCCFTERAKNASLLVYMSRHLVVYAKSLKNITDVTEAAVNSYNNILIELTRYALHNIPCNADTVRHANKDLLRIVLGLAYAVGLDKPFDLVFDKCLKQNCHISALCAMLEQVVAVAEIQKVLKKCAAIDDLFKKYLGREDCVNKLYLFMMTKSSERQDFETWFIDWGLPIIELAKQKQSNLPDIENIMSQAIKLQPKMLHKILNTSQLATSTELTALISFRNCSKNIVIPKFEHIESKIRDAICGLDDHNRLVALRYVADTPKLHDAPEAFELECVKNYVRYGSNNVDAHFRQLGYSFLNKILTRLELCLSSNDYVSKSKSLPSKQDLNEFLQNLIRSLILNLFPTANYGRRWISLRVLYNALETAKKVSLCLKQTVVPQTLPFLENCLFDSYENNKVVALALLKKLHECNIYDVKLRERIKPEHIMRLLVSLRPPDSAAGAFQLEYYCHGISSTELVQSFGMEHAALPNCNAVAYLALKWCLAELQHGLTLAQRNLSEGAKYNPLYGLLFASKHFLLDCDFAQLVKEPLWIAYICDLINLCLAVGQVVFPVVSSDSPEGHLPNAVAIADTDSVDVLSQRLSQAALASVNTTSQMVLLCAWRSVMETSLILGELVARAPLQSKENTSRPYLLGHAQITAIGEHFRLFLSETMHRGAFEQAYVGFSKVCQRFFASDERWLNELPACWLQDAMKLITADESDASASYGPTRRSAGLPYILQSVIGAELKLGTSANLEKTMCQLMALCESDLAKENAARTHALNIMRTLFRNSEMSDNTSEYTPRALLCALKCFDAPNWPERNSATLLFSTLLVRTFGVDKCNGKGHTEMGNRMSGRVFFTRHPDLYDYMHHKLQQAAAAVLNFNERKAQPLQLEAMLLLLSRLQSSELEGSESTLKIGSFSTFLMKLCRSHDALTRERAAMILVNILDHESFDVLVCQVIFDLTSLLAMHKNGKIKYVDLNNVHGLVLLIGFIHKKNAALSSEYKDGFLFLLALAAKQMLYENISLFHSIMKTLVDLLASVQQFSHGDYSELENLYQMDHNDVYQFCAQDADAIRQFLSFLLHYERLSGNANYIWTNMLTNLVKFEALPQAGIEFKIDLFLYLLIQSDLIVDYQIDFDIEEYSLREDVIRYAETLETQIRYNLGKSIQHSEYVYNDIRNLVKMLADGNCWHPSIGCKIYTLLGILSKMEISMEELFKRTEKANNELLSGLIVCFMRVIDQGILENSIWQSLLDFALLCSEPTQNAYLRFLTAQLCNKLLLRVSQIISMGIPELIGKFVQLVIQLSVDECIEVRNFAAEMIVNAKSQIIPTHLVLPPMALSIFLNYMVNMLAKYRNNSEFLIKLFHKIVEPFQSCAGLERHGVSTLQPQKVTGNVDLFDQQEANAYFEPVLVVNEVISEFRTSFLHCKELQDALKAFDYLYGFNTHAQL